MSRGNLDIAILRIREAKKVIRYAIRQLREANATRAADYVARSLKSVDGALRHAKRMESEGTR